VRIIDTAVAHVKSVLLLSGKHGIDHFAVVGERCPVRLILNVNAIKEADSSLGCRGRLLVVGNCLGRLAACFPRRLVLTIRSSAFRVYSTHKSGTSAFLEAPPVARSLFRSRRSEIQTAALLATTFTILGEENKAGSLPDESGSSWYPNHGRSSTPQSRGEMPWATGSY